MTKREVAEKYCFGRTNPEEYNERAELWASLEKQIAEMQAEVKELKDSVTSSYEAKLVCLLLHLSSFNFGFMMSKKTKSNIL